MGKVKSDKKKRARKPSTSIVAVALKAALQKRKVLKKAETLARKTLDQLERDLYKLRVANGAKQEKEADAA